MPLAEVDFVSPPEVIGVTASFFGGSIYLDPASSTNANTLVGATKFFTFEHNGLNQEWKAKNVYLYPPRDFLLANEQPKETLLFTRRKRFHKSAQRVWLEECIKRYRKAEFDEAIIFLTSSQVALLVTQSLNIDLPICILKKHPELYLDTPELSKLTNTRCLGFILYLPSPFNTEERIGDFIDAYNPLGRVYY
jgi:hypothetical protein